jgi:hypothetical protein
MPAGLKTGCSMVLSVAPELPMRTVRVCVVVLVLLPHAVSRAAQAPQDSPIQYKVLATTLTSSLERELNSAAAQGYKFYSVMGGETATAGKEIVAVVGRAEGAKPRYQYRLLATNRTSTMQRELQAGADVGFEYIGQTIFESAFGGQEVVCILEKDLQDRTEGHSQYRLFATTRTSTLERELSQAGLEGFVVLGLTIGKTAVGGQELVAIARRRAR